MFSVPEATGFKHYETNCLEKILVNMKLEIQYGCHQNKDIYPIWLTFCLQAIWLPNVADILFRLFYKITTFKMSKYLYC